MKAKGVANHRDGGGDPTELEYQFNRRTPPDRWVPHQSEVPSQPVMGG